MFDFKSNSKFNCTGIYSVLVVAAMTVPFSAQAAETDQKTRAEVKKEQYGIMSEPGPSTRIENVGQSTRLNVAHGETVTFRSQGQKFTWTFNGLEHQGLRLAVIAPAGFPAADASVHIGRNPTSRGK